MTVKMDKMGDTSYSPQVIPSKLPSGLKSIGMGLGSGGTPVNVQQLQGKHAFGAKCLCLFSVGLPLVVFSYSSRSTITLLLNKNSFSIMNQQNVPFYCII